MFFFPKVRSSEIIMFDGDIILFKIDQTHIFGWYTPHFHWLKPAFFLATFQIFPVTLHGFVAGSIG